MKRSRASRADRAWVLAGLSATAALTLSPLSWHWVLLGGVLAGLYYYIVYRLTDEPLSRAVTIAYGKTGGRVVLALTMLWTICAAGAAAAGADMAYPEDRMSLLAPACMLLLAAFGGFRGTAALAGAASVVALILGLLYGAVLLAAASEVSLRNLSPWGGGEQAAFAFCALLSASAALYLPQGEKRRRKLWPFLLAGLLPAAFAAATAGCLSPQVTARTRTPFYEMSRRLDFLGMFSRMEPVVSAAMLMGFFCLTSLLTQSAAEIGAALVPKIAVRWQSLLVCALSIGAVFLARVTPQVVQMGLAALFWGVIPLVTQAIVAVKIVRKKSKKSIDKPDQLW